MKSIAFTTILISLAIASSTSFAQTATPRVDKREAHQQAKIHQGIKSGELTRHEAITLEKQQAKIRRDEKKAKADGVVTPQERARLNRELDRSSRNIYAKKHNSRTR